MPEQLFNDRKFRVPFPVVYAKNTDFGKRMKRAEASQGLVSDSGLRKSLKIMSKVFFLSADRNVDSEIGDEVMSGTL